MGLLIIFRELRWIQAIGSLPIVDPWLIQKCVAKQMQCGTQLSKTFLDHLYNIKLRLQLISFKPSFLYHIVVLCE